MLERNQYIAVRPPRRHGREAQSWYRDGGQVLQAVYGHVAAPVEQGVLNLLGEDAEAAHAGERLVLNAVAGGFDEDEFNQPGRDDGPQPIGDVMRLPESERAAAGAE